LLAFAGSWDFLANIIFQRIDWRMTLIEAATLDAAGINLARIKLGSSPSLRSDSRGLASIAIRR
jgi:hypothetical protein